MKIYLRSENDIMWNDVNTWPVFSLEGRLMSILGDTRLLIPIIGLSQDRRIRIRWLFWAFYL